MLKIALDTPPYNFFNRIVWSTVSMPSSSKKDIQNLFESNDYVANSVNSNTAWLVETFFHKAIL